MGAGKGGSGSKDSQSDLTKVEDDGGERGHWDNQCDFFLSCLGYAVGLGNVWRFPYLCYRHGGGAFLFAYSFMLALAGLPLFYLELTVGQYGGLGPNKLFGRIAPAFKGLGYGMLFVTFLVAIYYNMIIAWTLFYTFAGMQDPLPWADCGNSYNDATCYKREMAEACNVDGSGKLSYFNNTCTAVEDICTMYNQTWVPDQLDKFNFTMCNNGTHDLTLDKVYTRTSPSEDYYKRVVLGLEEDTTWENYGGLKWELVLCLLGAWTIVCLCLIKGVQSSGKVVYFTALFPYLVLLILLVRGLTLDGAMDGISFYVQPKWETLKSIKVWSDAATQIFYSLGPSFGGLITLASYNKFTNNCHRDAVLIALSNCSTSVFAGFVIFSIIGFMAKEQGVPVEDVIASGPGLAFVAYPEAVAKMPGAQFFSFMFFLMLITLGLDSQFTMVETLTTAAMDQWPDLRKRKSLVVIGTSVLGFILGLSMCGRGGVYMFTLIDWYSASWSLLMLALIELIFLMYVYGFKNILNNIEEMTIKLNPFSKFYWLTNWLFVSPVIMAFIIVTTFVNFTPCSYSGYVFPDWVQAIGWLMASTAIAIVITIGFFEYYRRNNIAGKPTSVRDMFRPVEKWGPAIKTASPMRHHEAGATNMATSYDNDAFSYNSGSANSTHM